MASLHDNDCKHSENTVKAYLDRKRHNETLWAWTSTLLRQQKSANIKRRALEGPSRSLETVSEDYLNNYTKVCKAFFTRN